MTARLCPSGSECPSQRCAFHLSGSRCARDLEHPLTPDERARELKVSVRQLERIEELVIARLVVAVCRSVRRDIGDLDPGESEDATGAYTIPCRVDENPGDDCLAPRAATRAMPPLLRHRAARGALPSSKGSLR